MCSHFLKYVLKQSGACLCIYYKLRMFKPHISFRYVIMHKTKTAEQALGNNLFMGSMNRRNGQNIESSFSAHLGDSGLF